MDLKCPRCGFLFWEEHHPSICPKCGWDWNSPLGRIRTLLSRCASPPFVYAIPMLAFGLMLHFSAAFWVVAVITLAAAGRSLVLEKAHKGPYEPLTTLELRAPGPVRPIMPLTITPPAPPPIPQRWQALLSLPRPRDVHFKLGGQIRTILASRVLEVFTILPFLELVRDLHKNGNWFFFLQKNWQLGIVTGLWICVSARSIRNEIRARLLVRDGEATIGRIALWQQAGGRGSVTYMFWTRTGDMFEHSHTAVFESGEDVEKQLVPVFYSPENPERSIALNCTNWRVRVPEERFSRNRGNILARS